MYVFKKEHLVFGLECLIIAGITMIHFQNVTLPYILHDEYGYWSSAAYFAGYNWSEVIQEIPYYSYGYGVWLSLLYHIFKNPLYLYKAAVFLNCIFLWGSLWLLYGISKYYFKSANHYMLMFISGAVVLYSSNIAHANYTWPEIFLFFCFCLITYFVFKINENPDMLSVALLSIITVLTYTIHQRTLGILVAVSVSIVLMKTANILRYKHIFLFFIILLVLMYTHNNIKDMIVNQVWNNGVKVTVNDYSGQINKLQFIFSIEGLIAFITSISSKMYSMIISSCFLLLPVLEFFLINVFREIKNSLKQKKVILNIPLLFLLISFLATTIISSVFMIYPSQTSYLIYERYTDNILGPLLLVALLNLIYKKQDYRKFGIYLLFIFFLGSIVEFSIEYYNLVYKGASVSNVGMSIFFNGTALLTWYAFIISCLIYLFCIFIIKKNKPFIKGIPVLVLVCVWIYTGYHAYDTLSKNGWEDINPSIIENVRFIEEFEKKNQKKYKLYAMQGEDWTGKYYGTALQFYLYDRKITYVTEDDIDQISDNEYIILSHQDVQGKADWKIINRSGLYRVAIVNKYTINND